MNVEATEGNLLEIKWILDKYGVRFWLAFGTFLGAYRDGKLIPYDWDSDLAIFYEDSLHLLKALAVLSGEGYEIGTYVPKALLHLIKNGEKTDLCAFRIEGDKRVWQNIKYDVDDFDIENNIGFLGLQWRILNNPERWLAYTYGDDWKIPKENTGVGDGFPLG